MQRAWVMVRGKRDGDFYRNAVILRNELEKTPELYRKSWGVFGGYDMIVVIDAEDILHVYRAFSALQGVSHSGLQTQTLISIDPRSAPSQVFVGGQVFIGIKTKLGCEEEVRDHLARHSQFALVEVTLGEFDVVALLYESYTAMEALRDVIRHVPAILNTTTMLPHTFGEEGREVG